MLSEQQVYAFQQLVLEYYHANQRNLPWRQPEPGGSFNPYKIMVSEIMLQQTQVPRVIEKYAQFLEMFPAVQDLAGATLAEVLIVWQGLGYNRRGRFLREAAVQVCQQHGGVMPSTLNDLVTLPGIGVNTASAILAYAYDQPVTYIETNIRSVYLHHFFADSDQVSDVEILQLVSQTLWLESPREWYWALMDYGTYIKKQHGNPNRKSKHHVKQSKFEGSARQIRGQVLRSLADGPKTQDQLTKIIIDNRLEEVLQGLIKDQMIYQKDSILQIAD